MITQHIQSEVQRRIIEEGIPRLKKCISLLSLNQLWHQPNKNVTTIGNTILHLNGNVRQWLISSFTNSIDNRIRNEEFDPNNIRVKEDLLEILDQLSKDCNKVIPYLTLESLDKSYVVQCYSESGLSIVIHVIEHFSYHVGQVSLMTKLLLDIDLGYYDGQDLERTN